MYKLKKFKQSLACKLSDKYDNIYTISSHHTIYKIIYNTMYNDDDTIHIFNVIINYNKIKISHATANKYDKDGVLVFDNCFGICASIPFASSGLNDI